MHECMRVRVLLALWEKQCVMRCDVKRSGLMSDYELLATPNSVFETADCSHVTQI